jgi:hypothetical protein
MAKKTVERSSKALSKKTKSYTSNNPTFCLESASISMSYIEVYNEKVFDLLSNDMEPRRVRERPDAGPYVEGLTYREVDCYAQFQSLLDQGNAQRAVGSTLMNSQSSRSHAVFTIYVKQELTQPYSASSDDIISTITRKSKICLVDLAGSERASLTGAVGERLVEANNINKSLSTLGEVVKALSDAGQKVVASKKGQFIPYRNSMLTWILKGICVRFLLF